MLTIEQLENLPNHRLKEYLKVRRKAFVYAEKAWLEGDCSRKEFDEASSKFHLVKKECAKRPHFG